MKSKLLLSSVTLFAMVAVIVGGTTAMFSDVELADANVTTAGSVTLLITDITHTYAGDPGNAPVYDDNGVSFTLDDIKPLDEGSIDYQILNGQNEAYVCAMVTETANADNTLVNPEVDLGDDLTEGELQDYLNFQFASTSGSLTDISGTWQTVGVVSASTPTNSVIDYCFGEYSGSSCVENTTGNVNEAQTDSVTFDIEFYAEQTRNNPDFTCDDLNPPVPVSITSDDLAESFGEATSSPESWLFYNDTNDTVMTINQFSTDGGVNDIEAVAGSNGAARMVLDTNASPRYNIATFQFGDIALADIDTLTFRAQDASASGERPFFHFNVSFDGTVAWQSRMVFVPGASTNPDMTVGAWETIDPIAGGAGMWTWSGYAGNGNMWPDGNTDQYRSWTDILAAFPSAETHALFPFMGVRVGHPGPNGEEGLVDWIEVDGTTYDFES